MSYARRTFLQQTLSVAALAAPVKMFGQELATLEVAAAGAARSILEGSLRTAAASALQLNLKVHAMGADAVAKAILGGTLPVDVFVPITASPMKMLMDAGKVKTATPIARTEFVLVYSSKSRFLTEFEAAAKGESAWWKVLEEPGIRIARSNPGGDPSGRAMIFAMMLAEKKYKQLGLAQRVLGDTLNPLQINPGGDTQAKLASGEIDVVGSYRTGPEWSKMPYLRLPSDVNLSGDQVRRLHPEIQITVGEKTFYPEPLVFYTGVLKDAMNPAGAGAFVEWLRGDEAWAILAAHGFEAPGTAMTLTQGS